MSEDTAVEELHADIFVRDIHVHKGDGQMTLVFDLGPTPVKITDNPEEFVIEASISIKAGSVLDTISNSLQTLVESNKDVFVWRPFAIN